MESIRLGGREAIEQSERRSSALPGAASIFGIAANAVLKIGRVRACLVVDRALLARLLRRVHACSALPRASRELLV